MTMDRERLRQILPPKDKNEAYWRDRAIMAESRIRELECQALDRRPRRSRRRALYRMLTGQ